VDKEVQDQEYKDALRQLEEDNYLSLVGHKMKPTIRLVEH